MEKTDLYQQPPFKKNENCRTQFLSRYRISGREFLSHFLELKKTILEFANLKKNMVLFCKVKFSLPLMN